MDDGEKATSSEKTTPTGKNQSVKTNSDGARSGQRQAHQNQGQSKSGDTQGAKIGGSRFAVLNGINQSEISGIMENKSIRENIGANPITGNIETIDLGKDSQNSGMGGILNPFNLGIEGNRNQNIASNKQ